MTEDPVHIQVIGRHDGSECYLRRVGRGRIELYVKTPMPHDQPSLLGRVEKWGNRWRYIPEVGTSDIEGFHVPAMARKAWGDWLKLELND